VHDVTDDHIQRAMEPVIIGGREPENGQRASLERLCSFRVGGDLKEVGYGELFSLDPCKKKCKRVCNTRRILARARLPEFSGELNGGIDRQPTICGAASAIGIVRILHGACIRL
jgi:hypothetical protein